MENKTNVKICRIASLSDFDGVLIGRDLADIFKNGYVYSVTEIMGEIVIRELGEHATPKWLERGAKINQLLLSGVPMLTKDEYELQLKMEQNGK